MDFWNIATIVFIGSIFLLILYSVIRWVGAMVADRKNEEKRKKYARMCAIGILILVVAMILGFIVNYSRNTM